LRRSKSSTKRGKKSKLDRKESQRKAAVDVFRKLAAKGGGDDDSDGVSAISGISARSGTSKVSFADGKGKRKKKKYDDTPGGDLSDEDSVVTGISGISGMTGGSGRSGSDQSGITGITGSIGGGSSGITGVTGITGFSDEDDGGKSAVTGVTGVSIGQSVFSRARPDMGTARSEVSMTSMATSRNLGQMAKVLKDLPKKTKNWEPKHVQAWVGSVHPDMQKAADRLFDRGVRGKELMNLTRKDLKDLGVKKSKRRTMLLDAIEELR